MKSQTIQSYSTAILLWASKRKVIAAQHVFYIWIMVNYKPDNDCR